MKKMYWYLVDYKMYFIHVISSATMPIDNSATPHRTVFPYYLYSSDFLQYFFCLPVLGDRYRVVKNILRCRIKSIRTRV